MKLARVDGTVVSTICHPSLKGWRVLICQPVDEAGAELGAPVLAVDKQGAGLHQRVLVTTDGRSIRERVGDAHSPIRHMVISILDD